MNKVVTKEENQRLQWASTTNFEELPGKVNSFEGYVYAARFQNQLVKIGSTNDVKIRMQTINGTTGAYGNNPVIEVAYTEPHVDFRKNERLLHTRFQAQRAHAKELFNITLDRAMAEPVFNHALVEVEMEKASAFAKDTAASIYAPHDAKDKAQMAAYLGQLLQNPEEALSWIDNQIKTTQDHLRIFESARQCVEHFAEVPELCKRLAEDRTVLKEIIKQAADPSLEV